MQDKQLSLLELAAELEAATRNIYDGTDGFVEGSDTSVERATSDSKTGKSRARQVTVLSALRFRPDGMTWRELGEALGLHHGQISATLSVLHRAGKVFQLKAKRGGCHPYVLRAYIDNFHPSQTILDPSMTKAGIIREAYRELLMAAKQHLEDDSMATRQGLSDAIASVERLSSP